MALSKSDSLGEDIRLIVPGPGFFSISPLTNIRRNSYQALKSTLWWLQHNVSVLQYEILLRCTVFRCTEILRLSIKILYGLDGEAMFKRKTGINNLSNILNFNIWPLWYWSNRAESEASNYLMFTMKLITFYKPIYVWTTTIYHGISKLSLFQNIGLKYEIGTRVPIAKRGNRKDREKHMYKR